MKHYFELDCVGGKAFELAYGHMLKKFVDVYDEICVYVDDSLKDGPDRETTLYTTRIEIITDVDALAEDIKDYIIRKLTSRSNQTVYHDADIDFDGNQIVDYKIHRYTICPCYEKLLMYHKRRKDKSYGN